MHPIALALIIILAVLAVFAIALVVLTKPAKYQKGIEKFTSVRYAHRGLHGNGVPENSLLAFKLAVERGYGIELDVRLSKDKVLVVFHDDTLTRVCGIDKRVDELTAEELRDIRLSGTDEYVPTFDEVLNLIDGKVKLLCEIKEAASDSEVSIAAAERLKSYKGEYVVESFNPLSVARAKKLLPDIYCGLLCEHYTLKDEYKKPLYHILQNFFLNVKCRPDFIAYNHLHRGYHGFKLMKLYGAPTFAYTVKSKDEEKAARDGGFDTVIFEGYIPED